MVGKRSTSALRKEPDAVVVAFPVRRSAEVFSAVPLERPVVPELERGPFRLAIVLSLALHVVAFAAAQSWTENDLERALGNAATPAAVGTVVLIPVEIVADSALPTAAAPTNTTTPEAQTPNPAAVAEPEKPEPESRLVAEPVPSTAPPPPLAAEVPAEERVAPLPDAKAPEWHMVEEKPEPKPVETPKPVEQKTAPKEVRRTVARPAAPSVAAAPARPAASATPGRAGNRGNIETGGAALVSSYQAQVQAHLQRFRTYSEEARSRRISGVVKVHFVLGRDGQVLSARVVGSSGNSILDQAGLAIVRRASPFPPFPPGLNLQRFERNAPLNFELR